MHDATSNWHIDTGGNPEPRDLISSSEPPGSFPTFNHVMKSDKSADDDEIDDEPSEVSCIIILLILLIFFI